MNTGHFLEIMGGLAVFLFSLRLFYMVLERAMLKRVRQFLGRYLLSPLHCFGFGFLATLLLQTSTITTMMTMGLTSSALLTLEQAIFIVLGAAVGTTVKVWIFAAGVKYYLWLLIAIGVMVFLTCHRFLVHDYWEILVPLALAFFGWSIVVSEWLRFAQHPYLVAIFTVYDVNSFSGQLLTAVIGSFLAVVLQGNSLLIFWVILLASSGSLSPAVGAALILGANVGSALTGMVLSLGNGANARRLAMAHFFMKSGGVLLVLLFFPYLVSGVKLLLPQRLRFYPEYHLAAFHTVFNVLNACLWASLLPLMTKLVYWLIPREPAKQSLLPAMVRRILVSNPRLTLEEIATQMRNVEAMSKKLSDRCLQLLGHSQPVRQQISRKTAQDFENLKECVLELTIKVTRHPLTADNMAFLRHQLKLLGRYSDLADYLLALDLHLERGLADGYLWPAKLQPQLEEFQTAYNELWLAVFLNKKACAEQERLQRICTQLTENYMALLNKDAQNVFEQLAWVYETIHSLEEMSARLYAISAFDNQNGA